MKMTHTWEAKAVMTLTTLVFLFSCASPNGNVSNDRVKTTFQTSKAWSPAIDTRADAVMVYGAGKALKRTALKVSQPSRTGSDPGRREATGLIS